MLKIGITTHYFNSTNYGGNLQAYALCRYLNNHGFDAVQISYDRSLDNPLPKSLIGRGKRYLRKFHNKLKKLPTDLKTLSVRDEIAKRQKAVLEFNQSIPHTRTYNAQNISSVVDEFDVFITGSDQVWNPLAVCSAYLLDFVNHEKKFKISYAASISANELPVHIIERYKNSLKDYFAISVRENQAIQLLQSCTDKTIDLVLDPTLLLNIDEWNNIKISSDIREHYLFCYFLGNSHEQRELAKKFAQTHNLKIVTIPYLNGTFRNCDKNFGDIKLSDVSPEKFIGLITGAEYVFTDSFHATVFSVLFQKQFFVFDRIIKQSLGSRIKDLTTLFDMEDRFCNTTERMSLDYIQSVNTIDYSQRFSKYEEMKTSSETFLLDNLHKVKDMINK